MEYTPALIDIKNTSNISRSHKKAVYILQSIVKTGHIIIVIVTI
jgi:hypothetical protein